jgi:NodT family efflux transporter outer membrane factor (OMF) lipoprotein
MRMGQRRMPLQAAYAALFLLAGCAMGPDFQPPAALPIGRFTTTQLPQVTSGAGSDAERVQHFVDAQTTPLAWWTVLGSSEINSLVDRALASSPTISTAEAALRQAQELVAAQRGGFFPTVSASYSGTRARVPGEVASPVSSGASLYTLHTAQVSVGYVVDVFGANRRAVEALQAQGEAQLWQLRAAQLTLAANVASAALQEASLREQLASTERLLSIADRQWQLLGVQQRLGEAAGVAVLTQEALVHQTEGAAAALRKQLAQQHDLLAVLVGSVPADVSALQLKLSTLRLPDVPIGLPARLVAQRPDVRSAQAQLQAANAQIGVAVANMLPQITLSTDFGSGAQELSQLFRAGGLLWSVGAGLTQPIFQGGTLLHRKRAAEAQTEQALGQYRSTVLTAFQGVADSLEAVVQDADQLVAASAQERAAQAALRAAQRQLELGSISVLTLLSAENAAQQASIARVQAQASRFSDVVAVYQALGGSWNDVAATELQK